VLPVSDAGPSRGEALLWVVCGSGRGVGKTHLARALGDILPESAYAKQGTSRRKPGKAQSFFRTGAEVDTFLRQARAARHRHVVVESNDLVRRGAGDIIIFVAGHAVPRGPRPDAGLLRSLAHVVLDAGGPATDPSGWRETLAGKGLEPAVIGQVLEALVAQAEWNRRARG
jgi:hypothetical protein